MRINEVNAPVGFTEYVRHRRRLLFPGRRPGSQGRRLRRAAGPRRAGPGRAGPAARSRRPCGGCRETGLADAGAQRRYSVTAAAHSHAKLAMAAAQGAGTTFLVDREEPEGLTTVAADLRPNGFDVVV